MIVIFAIILALVLPPLLLGASHHNPGDLH